MSTLEKKHPGSKRKQPTRDDGNAEKKKLTTKRPKAAATATDVSFKQRNDPLPDDAKKDKDKSAKRYEKQPTPPQTPQTESRADARLKQKSLLLKRKAGKANADMIRELTPLWEILRQRTPTDKAAAAAVTVARQQAIATVLEMVGGKETELVKKSTGSRILQAVVQHGSEEQRQQLVRALCGSVHTANDVYAQHVYKKLIKVSGSSSSSGSATLRLLQQSIKGALEQWLTRRIAAGIVDALYGNLDGKGRNALVAEVYLKEFGIGHGHGHGGSDPVFEGGVERLLARQPAKRDVVLGNLAALIPKLASKELLALQIVQRILLDYLRIEAPQKLTEGDFLKLFFPAAAAGSSSGSGGASASADAASVSGAIEAMMQTSSLGAEIVCRLVGACGARHRKTLLKSILKPFLATTSSMLVSASQVNIVMALLAFTDDTVLTGAILVPAILQAVFPTASASTASAPILEPDRDRLKVALRPLMYLLAGKQNKYLTQQVVHLLDSIQGTTAKLTSKKEEHLRRTELLHSSLLPALTPLILATFEQLVASEDTSASLLPEYLAVCDQATRDLLLDRIVAMGLEQLMTTSVAGDRLVRSIVKRSEALAMSVLSRMANAGSLMEWARSSESTCYLLVLMLRYEQGRERLAPLAEQLASHGGEGTAANALFLATFRKRQQEGVQVGGATSGGGRDTVEQ